MKVTSVELLACDAGWRNYHFVKLVTDSGIVGWSEFDEGFGALKLWMDAIPFEGMGPWSWKTYWGSEMKVDYDLPNTDMKKFWKNEEDAHMRIAIPAVEGKLSISAGWAIC